MFTRATLVLVLLGGVCLAEDPKPADDKIADFVDNTEKYKGKEVTFTLKYLDPQGIYPLRTRLGDKGVVFKGRDSKNKAELAVGIDLGPKLEVPNAKDGEEVIVTFKCGDGKLDKGNVAVKIRRP